MFKGFSCLLDVWDWIHQVHLLSQNLSFY